ncbi:MAG: hypothetical protein ACJZ39_03700 [Candidatus Thalassarchaeaceae archaeon]
MVIGWISTWNVKCGISTYSANILKYISSDYIVLAANDNDLIKEDENNVHRCWNKNSDNFANLISCIDKENIRKVVIQHHTGLILFRDLNKLILLLLKNNIDVSVTLHNTKERSFFFRANSIYSAKIGLKLCKNIFVHSVGDMGRLRKLGINDNIVHVPHGIYDNNSDSEGLFVPQGKVMGTFGFMMPHKGFTKLIQVFAELEEWDHLIMLCSEKEGFSEETKLCLVEINKSGLENKVTLDTSFHNQDVIISTLSKCDLVVFPYQNTKESASGAVRMAVSAGSAIAVTPLDIFSDIEGAIVMKGTSVEKMIDSISNIDEKAMALSSANIKSMGEEFRWPHITGKIEKLI